MSRFQYIYFPCSPMYFIVCINKSIIPTRYPSTPPDYQRDPYQNVKVPWRGAVRVGSQVTNGGESNDGTSGSHCRGPWWPRGCVGELNQVPKSGLWIKIDLTGPLRCQVSVIVRKDQGNSVPLRVRPNTSYLVFWSISLTTEFTMSGSLACCEINTLMAP